MYYSIFKYLHILTVNLTFGFFMVRGYWMIINSPLLNQRWVRIVPHVNDTFLISAALTMTYFSGSGWRFFTQGWLIAKLLALVVYIILGSMAIRPGRPKWVRVIAWLLALLVFAYIVLVAVSKDPWPF
ncbi:Invasion gene expression up-regulator SirB [Gammaproteobacteria bacterium]